MATLADELAADLDFTDDEEEVKSDYDEEEEARKELENEEQDHMDLNSSNANDNFQGNPDSVRKICKLLYSKQTQDVFQARKHYLQLKT